MKIVIALVATVIAAPLALALTAFFSGLVHAPHEMPALREEELGT